MTAMKVLRANWVNPLRANPRLKSTRKNLWQFPASYSSTSPANSNLLKVNNRNSRKRWAICSTLTIKTPQSRHWRSIVSIVYFEWGNISWVYSYF